MTLDVYPGRKTTTQQHCSDLSVAIFRIFTVGIAFAVLASWAAQTFNP